MNPLIYIIWPGSNHTSYQASQLMQSVASKGGRSSVLNLLDHTPEDIEKMEKPFGFIFNNFVTPAVNQQLAVIRSWNVPGINDVDAQTTISNKWSCYNKLVESGIKIPKTVMINTENILEDIDQCVDEIGGFPVVIKPIYGLGGVNVSLTSTREELIVLLSNLKAIGYKAVLLQRYFSYQKDVVFSVWRSGSDIDCTLRIGSPYNQNKFKSDHSEGRARIPYRSSQELYDLSQQVMDCFGIKATRLDVLVGSDGYYVIDVNTPGGFEGYDKIFKGNYSDKLVSLLLGE